MKKGIKNLIYIVIPFFFINWSAQEATIEGKKKQEINFYGTVTTRQEKTFKVENISIAGLFKQIPLYESPAKTEDTSHFLKSDPKRGIITRIDLVEICNIKPGTTIWTYQKGKGYRKVEYIEIIVTSNDQQKTQNTYLIELTRKIICEEVNDAGPIEKEIPLDALKNLNIEGYKYRDMLNHNMRHNAQTQKK